MTYTVRRYEIGTHNNTNTINGFPNGAFFHAIYSGGGTINTLHGEFGRAKYVTNHAAKNKGVATAIDRGYVNGLHNWLRQHEEPLWIDSQIGQYATKDEANQAALEEDAKMFRLRRHSIRKKSYCAEFVVGAATRPHNWKTSYNPKMEVLYGDIERMLEPLSLSDTELKDVQLHAYRQFNKTGSKINTRGDVYECVCDYLGIPTYV